MRIGLGALHNATTCSRECVEQHVRGARRGEKARGVDVPVPCCSVGGPADAVRPESPLAPRHGEGTLTHAPGWASGRPTTAAGPTAPRDVPVPCLLSHCSAAKPGNLGLCEVVEVRTRPCGIAGLVCRGGGEGGRRGLAESGAVQRRPVRIAGASCCHMTASSKLNWPSLAFSVVHASASPGPCSPCALKADGQGRWWRGTTQGTGEGRPAIDGKNRKCRGLSR